MSGGRPGARRRGGPHSPREGRAGLGQAVPPADLGDAVAERRLDVGDREARLREARREGLTGCGLGARGWQAVLALRPLCPGGVLPAATGLRGWTDQSDLRCTWTLRLPGSQDTWVPNGPPPCTEPPPRGQSLSSGWSAETGPGGVADGRSQEHVPSPRLPPPSEGRGRQLAGQRCLGLFSPELSSGCLHSRLCHTQLRVTEKDRALPPSGGQGRPQESCVPPLMWLGVSEGGSPPLQRAPRPRAMGRLTSTSCLLASTRMGTPSRASLATIFSGMGERRQ